MVPTGLHLATGIVQRSASQSTSLHSISLTMPGARNGQRIEAQGKANNVTKPRSRPRCADELEDARHVAWFGDLRAFPKMYDTLAIVRPDTVIRWHRTLRKALHEN
jgi:hypothetical protein